MALSIGKFLGATTFGILSDKFGRRTSCTIGAGLHILGGILSTFSPWYWLFLLGRLSLGASSSGLFYAGFTLCKKNLISACIYIKIYNYLSHRFRKYKCRS